MIVGVTGTRFGMTTAQFKAFETQLAKLFTAGSELHHGDCKGADAQAAEMAKEIGYFIVGHPPIEPRWRAYFPSDRTMTTRDYHERNRNIVLSTVHMLAAPQVAKPQVRGGTWHAIRYADQQHRPLTIVFPDGSIEERRV